MQASGKFDLKEPYYRQLTPQAAAAWPQQTQADESEQQLAQQSQTFMPQLQIDPTYMQQAVPYDWSAQPPGLQQLPVMGQNPDVLQFPVGQPSDAHQWRQQGFQ